jgi:hypothetical protein
MAKPPTQPKFDRRDEIDLVTAAREALPSDFPNPERINCPEASTLEAIAARRLSDPDIDDLIDHIATCSPCFTAYSEYRNAYCSRRNKRRYGALAVFLAVATVAGYFGRKAFWPTPRSPEQIAEVAPLTAVLDFHDRTSERSDQTPPQKPEDTPHLRRTILNAQIRLPLGSEDGQYSLQFRDSAGGIKAQTTGTARFDGTNETLSARIDLRTIEPGRYTLAIRQGTSSWRQYSVFVD